MSRCASCFCDSCRAERGLRGTPWFLGVLDCGVGFGRCFVFEADCGARRDGRRQEPLSPSGRFGAAKAGRQAEEALAGTVVSGGACASVHALCWGWGFTCFYCLTRLAPPVCILRPVRF